LDAQLLHDLKDAAKKYEYVFAYSLVDLGAVDGFSRSRSLLQLIFLQGSQNAILDRLHKTNTRV
jgi:hypothetical protein